MKRLITVAMALALSFSVAACNGTANVPTSGGVENAQNQGSDNGTSETAVLDLSGGWKQSNSNSKTSYQVAMIADGTIEVYWKNETDNSESLYWAGTYTAPTSETNEYTWDSANDKSRTDRALLASGDDTKTFTHKKGIISYSVSAMGTTTTVELKRSDDVNIQVQKAVSVADLLPLELLESGYAFKSGGYIQYAFVVENPNSEKAVEFPKLRITARDAKGAVLGTQEVVGNSISPEGTWHSAFLGPSVDAEPATVDFELVQPEGSDWVSPSSVDYAGEALTVENPVKRENKIVGEVVNPNDFSINSVAVVVLFRDDNGKLLAGETTYTDKVSAGGKLPFEISVWGSGDSYITDNFEVYAHPWY